MKVTNSTMHFTPQVKDLPTARCLSAFDGQHSQLVGDVLQLLHVNVRHVSGALRAQTRQCTAHAGPANSGPSLEK